MWAGMPVREDSGWREKWRCQDSVNFSHSEFDDEGLHPQIIMAYLRLRIRHFPLSPLSTSSTTVTDSIFRVMHTREPQRSSWNMRQSLAR